MKIGVAKEIKSDEYRVALTPAGARELVQRGHEVTIETGAGVGSSFPDDAYTAAGAELASVEDVWADSELLLKVKEPIEPEYGRLREGSSSSRTSTSPQTSRSPARSSTAASRASPTRPSRRTTGGCRCSRR